MMTRKDSRVVVITGGTAGIGRATARRFAREGCSVAVLARGEERLKETEAELRELGANALGVSVDVADAAAIDAAADRIESELGPISVWVNNAMTSVFAAATDIAPDEYRRVTEVCYLGYVHGALAALRCMKPRDRGHLIFVGSAVAYRGIPLQAAYSGAKHAIQGFFDALRTELLHAHSGIRLTMVQMPAVNTPQFEWCRSKLPKMPQPLPPIYQPEVAADGIYFASTSDRREVWVGASTVKGIVGNRLAPWYADRYLAQHGFEGQMTDDPKPQAAPDNLFQPVSGPHAAHGRFNEHARSRSVQLWASKHRTALLASGAAMLFWAVARVVCGSDSSLRSLEGDA